MGINETNKKAKLSSQQKAVNPALGKILHYSKAQSFKILHLALNF